MSPSPMKAILQGAVAQLLRFSTKDGSMVYESGPSLEQAIVAMGHYPGTSQAIPKGGT